MRLCFYMLMSKQTENERLLYPYPIFSIWFLSVRFCTGIFLSAPHTDDGSFNQKGLLIKLYEAVFRKKEKVS